MQTVPSISPSLVAWSIAERPLAGETVCGDAALVKVLPDGTLLAAVDGLGHGKPAAEAARTALGVLESHAGEPLTTLMHRCHQALTRTRGVVMTLAFLQPAEKRLTWLGVGNVESVLVRDGAGGGAPRSRAVLRNGLLGLRLPALRSGSVPLVAGDLVILATDGIKPDFARGLPPGLTAQELAEEILARHFKGTDDALALVARYLGPGHA